MNRAVIVAAAAALFFACGPSTTLPLAQCNERLGNALVASCTNATTTVDKSKVDCRQLAPSAANCTAFNEDEVDVCATNIRNAANCDAALKVTCLMHCR